MLRRALDEAEGSVTRVARRLGLTRAHVYDLIRAFGIERNRNGQS